MSELSWTYLFFSLAFIPFTGYLVRFRLAYHPKSRKPSFFNVSSSVFKNEGLEGVYSGTFPTFILLLLIPVFCPHPILMISPSPPSFEGPLGALTLRNIIYSFGLVCVYRAITSPTPLPLLRTTGTTALHALFTPHETARFFALVYPGVLPAIVLSMVLDGAIATPLLDTLQRGIDLNLDLPEAPLGELHVEWRDVVVHWRYAAVVGVVLAKVLLLTPLEVVCTRMAVQRSWGPGGRPKSVEPTTGIAVVEHAQGPPGQDLKSPVEKIASDVDVELELESGLPAPVSATAAPAEEASGEFVLRYRPDDKEPYEGMLDCVRKIVREEGWGVLYRGWWVTLVRVSGLGW